ncbi:uncharacterized protein LOC100384062 precursor [Zea mays]|uniref:Uncharacterized protein n=1 Tax=Zea mays TaxID=4577 RepID=C0PL87_MAIZE|nr:uncharacterized protein LOC100384062 precursor [Zea mays]ACN35953.1 unknown [Zea mays]|eukprot:NP_001170135.1 uncharacterized protein LOC100384062 precursor [Zea mays]
MVAFPAAPSSSFSLVRGASSLLLSCLLALCAMLPARRDLPARQRPTPPNAALSPWPLPARTPAERPTLPCLPLPRLQFPIRLQLAALLIFFPKPGLPSWSFPGPQLGSPMAVARPPSCSAGRPPASRPARSSLWRLPPCVHCLLPLFLLPICRLCL